MTKSIASSLALLVASTAFAADPADLPVKRVVLYKHGVGYFERRGAIEGSTNLSLSFKTDEMSDVLKSLTVLDTGGGTVAAIAYDSQKPTSEILADFAFDLRTNDIQLAMLRQLRGARVAIDVAGRGRIEGAVLGIDDRTAHGADSVKKSPALSLFRDDGEIVTVELFDARSLEFLDDDLAADLQRYLATLRAAQRRDRKSVEIVCEGEGTREVLASYTIEQPVWKASYRLVLLPEPQRPLLQGWAIVDNTSDEDWSDVELSLIAGLPVAFRHDLYTPRSVLRPLLDVTERATADLGALMDDASSESEDQRIESKKAGSAEKAKFARKAPAPRTAAASPAEANALSFDEAFDAQRAESVTREIGDLLEYRIDHAVTIPRNRSAMIPIVKSAVDGARVALYRERARARNPLSAVRLSNTSGLSLEGGPLTVLEGETYAGEAYLDALKPNELRYVPFAVELGIQAESKLDSRQERVHRVTFKHGVMESRNDYREIKTYSFTHRGTQPRRVIVEHEKRNGWRLLAPQNPLEDELTTMRFAIDLAPGATAGIEVIEAFEQQSSFRIMDLADESVIAFDGQGILTPESRRFLKDVVGKKAEIAELDRTIAANTAEQNAIAKDQERVRGNLRALRSSQEEKELRRTYLQQLQADEVKLSELRNRHESLRADLAVRKAALDATLAEFSLEYEVK